MLDGSVSSEQPSSLSPELPEEPRAETDQEDHRIPWVRVGARWRRLVDGGGRCSYGRFLPEDRPTPPLGWLRDLIFKEAVRCDLITELQNMGRKVDQGDSFSNPFEDQAVCALRERVCSEIARRGDFDLCWLLEVSEGQPFYLNMLTGLGKLASGFENDFEFPSSIQHGVDLGVNEDLPRNPTVFSEKTRHRFEITESLPHDCGGFNSQSTAGHEEFIQNQLEEDVSKGFRIRCDSDLSLIELLGGQPVRGKLSVAVKTKHNQVEKRLVYNNTANGGNQRIRVRDLIEQPGLADLKIPMCRSQTRGVSRNYGDRRYAFLKFDYSKAHNRIKVKQKDWKYQCCTWNNIHYVQLVGCFGTSSIAYWCSRLLSYIKRIEHLVFGGDWFSLLYADDTLQCLPLGSFWPEACCHLLFVVLVGGPLNWSKTSMGMRCDWVGFHCNGLAFKLGVCKQRAEETCLILLKAISSGFCTPADLCTGVGKLAWIVQALEWLRPWLQPLYKFIHGPPLYTRLPVHPTVFQAISFLTTSLRSSPDMVPMELSYLSDFCSAADAAASDSHVGIGGWFHQGSVGSAMQQKDVFWFSVELTKTTCPWAFDNESKSAHIDALELLATFALITAAKAHLRETQFSIKLPVLTDNQGNGYILTKMFTMRQPAASVLMAMSKFCMRELCMPLVQWVPREKNVWADAASKGELSGFHKDRRVQPDLHCLRFINDLVASSKLPLDTGAIQDGSP